MLKQLAQSVVELAAQHGAETTCGFDGTDWSEQDIEAFIDEAHTLAQSKSVKLKGVRVGGDILAKLGGTSPGFVNARLQKNRVPIVAVPEFGKVELVFRP